MNIMLILISIYMILGIIASFILIIFKDDEEIKKISLRIIGVVITMITFGATISYVIG